VHILPPVAPPGLSWTLRALLLKEGEKGSGKEKEKDRGRRRGGKRAQGRRGAICTIKFFM